MTVSLRRPWKRLPPLGGLFSRNRRRRRSGAPNTGAGIREDGRIAALEAVIWAIEQRAELSELAYQSADTAELDQQFAQKCGSGAEQCNLIRSMSAQRMTRASRLELHKELDGLRAAMHFIHDADVD